MIYKHHFSCSYPPLIWRIPTFINSFIREFTPMNTALSQHKTISPPWAESQRLRQLKMHLMLNRQAQQKMKVLQNTIRERMKLLEEYIATYQLNILHPPATGLLSYIKFQRNLPASLKEQMKIGKEQLQLDDKDDDNNSESEFIKKLNLPKEDKRMDIDVASLPKDPHRINFVQQCKGTQFRNGMQLYRALMDLRRAKQPKRLFNLQEDELLLEKKRMYGQNWEKVNQFFENRLPEQINYEYHNRVQPHLTTGRWTPRQTLMLIVLLEHFGSKRWGIIASKMKVKNELQVRERYSNLIDPSIGKDVWTYELQKKLLEIAEDYGFCWKKMSQLPIFKYKTDNSLWRRYKSLMIRFSEEEIREMLPDIKSNRGLADKIIKEKRIYDSRKRAASNKPQPPIYYRHFKPKQTVRSLSEDISSSVVVVESKARPTNDFFQESFSHFQIRVDDYQQ